jgi:uncharacterized protein
MSSERTLAPLLPFVASQSLTDHHCHGLLRAGGDLEGLLNEGGATAGGSAFDSLAGLAFRRWCPPLLDLPAHTSVADYQARRAELGVAEVNRRFLAASGLDALLVDTGFAADALHSPGETAAFAGASAFEIVRLEQVAESLAASGVSAGSFPDAFRAGLERRVMSPAPGVPVVGVKSIAAYRVGLELDGRRPDDAEVVAAAGGWLGRASEADDGGARSDGAAGRGAGRTTDDGGARSDGAAGRGAGRTTDDGGARSGGAAGGGAGRLADETLHRFFIWCGADLGLPVQFHVGYGDRDVDLHRCNPLLLTGLLRALEPTGVPVMLLHNYPYHREAGYLAQVFPNVYADLGLAAHNVGSRAPEVLAEALELVPLRKFLFSTDAYGLPELYYLGTLLFRLGLSRFLRARLDDDDICAGDAERITTAIGAENARRAYRIPA